MSRQHTRIAFVGDRQRGSSAILHQKMHSILFQNSSFSKMKQVELDTGENSRRPRSDVYQSTN